MFFILSKILAFLIRPFIWALGALIWSLITKNQKRKRRLAWTSLSILLIFSNQPLFNGVIGWWEMKTLTAQEITTPYDIGILLGGYSRIHPEHPHQRYDLSSRANRFVNTVELYKRGKIRKILLTGGNGRVWVKRPIESQVMAEFLKLLGVPAEDIMVEPQSRNTWENARYSKELIEEKMPGANCLIITSAWHLPRAARCFTRAGLPATPFAVDHAHYPPEWSPEWVLLPNPGTMRQWNALIKEWIGLIVYQLKGFA